MWIRILIDIVLIILGTVIVVGFLSLKPPRMPITIKPDDMGLKYYQVIFRTRDGKNLNGWLIPSEKSRGIIICCHGYPANKSDILPTVDFLYPDFALFLFDFRAHGESGGFITTFGLREVWDLEAAIEYLESVPSTRGKPIGVWGYSLGGAVGILTAARNSEIKAIVSDSSFANFPEMVTQYFKNMGPFRYIFSYLSRLLGKVLFRMDYIENSPEFHVGKVKAPILLIHSRTDEFVPIDHARRIYQKANSPKELWEVDGTHTGMHEGYISEYQERVKNWFERYLK